jgi:hypothetical protein
VVGKEEEVEVVDWEKERVGQGCWSVRGKRLSRIVRNRERGRN